MGARSGGAGGGFGGDFSSLPRGGFATAPFKGAARIGDLKDGDMIVGQTGNQYKVSILKQTKTQVVIGSKDVNDGYNGYMFMVANKNAYVNGKKL